jgi:hypothetical protein
MPQFTTISPTHIPGQKPRAWERFRDGRYVAIGWLDDVDLAGKSIDEITDLLRRRGYDNETAAIHSFEKFLSLNPGDYVAVNNTNHGLFGIGIIESGYKFQLHKHDCGDPEEFYPHYRDVKWVKTAYMPRTSLVSEGETPWQPYGTVGKVYPELPPYIARLLEISLPVTPNDLKFLRPPDFKLVLEAVEVLRKERDHKERAHESLVEDFFVALGYVKHKDIKYRQGRVDIKIETAGQTLLIAEVKADWNLSRANRNGIDAIKQAYNYAHDQGIRYVIVTNGDTYILFDRLKGLSWESNLLGEFQLTALQQEDMALIERLRPARLSFTDPGEALRHLAESFSSRGSAGTSRGLTAG